MSILEFWVANAAIFIICVLVLGLLVGSFLNVDIRIFYDKMEIKWEIVVISGR